MRKYYTVEKLIGRWHLLPFPCDGSPEQKTKFSLFCSRYYGRVMDEHRRLAAIEDAKEVLRA